MSTNDLISASLNSGIGQMTLNRPETYNALNTPMVTAIHETLEAWKLDPLHAVVFRSGTTKAFCAGGDIKSIRQLSVAGDVREIEDFFAQEYRMNACIAAYPKPVISLINGICMGGGMGIAIHGRFRIVSERAVLAMPETAIGFFPDIGSSYFLPRLPGALGMYLALTGHQMDYRDALYCGLATHYVPSETIEMIPDVLAEKRRVPVSRALAEIGTARPETGGHLAEHRTEIDWCFAAPTVTAIRTRLESVGSHWARSVMEHLTTLSPQSLEITLQLLQWGGQRSLEECLHMELRMTRSVTGSDDFIEGVRAALVDKDRNPAWAKYKSQSLEQLLVPMQA